jgi:hypothetical protein
MHTGLTGKEGDMPGYDFTPWVKTFPEVIRRMKRKFTSHDFIREWSWRHQDWYVEALYAYRDVRRDGTGDAIPFQQVHREIMREMALYYEGKLVRRIGEKTSRDIFGHDEIGVVVWKRI